MIEGSFAGQERPWPMVRAVVSIAAADFSATVEFLVDTGSEWTTLGPRAAEEAGLRIAALTPVAPVVGLGGDMPAVTAEAQIRLGAQVITTRLHVMVPRPEQRERLYGIPSALGRDVLQHFTLVQVGPSQRLVLLEPGETLQTAR